MVDSTGFDTVQPAETDDVESAYIDEELKDDTAGDPELHTDVDLGDDPGNVEEIDSLDDVAPLAGKTGSARPPGV